MASGTNLFWLRVRRTSTNTDGHYGVTHEVALLSDLTADQLNHERCVVGGFTERWSPMFLVGDRGSISRFGEKC